MRIARVSLLLILFCAPPSFAGALSILACEPEWAALASVIAGPEASVATATSARQDPHHVQARPSLLAAVRRADMVICTGAGLEEAWLPVLLARGGNPSVQNTPGLFLAAEHVTLMDRPEVVARAAGDVHAAGNPHFHLDPRLLPDIADALAEQLAVLRPTDTDAFRTRAEEFRKRWEARVRDWQKLAAPLKQQQVVVHHRSWNYLARWLGLKIVGELEPRPGIPPSPVHLASLRKTVGNNRVLILRAGFDDARPSRWLAQRSRGCTTVLPFSADELDENGLTQLFDGLIHSLLAARGKCNA